MLHKYYPSTLEDCLTWFDEKTAEQDTETGLFPPPYIFSKFISNTPYILSREVERKEPGLKDMPMGASE